MKKNKNKKIVVFGSTGMVGSSICRLLKKKKYRHVFHPQKKELNLLNASQVDKYFKKIKPDLVIMPAGKVGGIMINNIKKYDFLYENLQMGTNVINYAFKNNIKDLIYFGSSCIYPKNTRLPIKEDSILSGKFEETNDAYALAKVSIIKLCEYLNREFNTNYISLIPCNLYGPNDNYNLLTSHVLPALINKIHISKIQKTNSVTLWGDGRSKREFLYVDDLASACEIIIKSGIKNNQKTINIGSSKEITIKELTLKIMKVLKHEVKIKFDKTKPNGVRSKKVNDKIIRQLGWKENISLERGIQLSYKNFLKNNNI